MATRMMMTYMSSGCARGEGFTFASIAMISLLLAGKAMKCSEIVDDVVNGKKDNKASVYSSIHYVLDSLERSGFVRRGDNLEYKPTKLGERVFEKFLDESVKTAAWSTLTDSRKV